MTAITTFTGDKLGSLVKLREKTAEIGNSAVAATVDWIDCPPWATGMTVYLNLTALAGTTRTMDFKILEANPVSRDDSQAIDFAGWDGITQLTAVAQVVTEVGPGITGIADDDTGVLYKVNSPVAGKLLGFRIATDRTDADETYTYTLAVRFWK